MKTFLRRFHLAATIFWGTAGLAVSMWLRSSLVWIVAMSWYAIVISHWGCWQASRAERAADTEEG